MSDQYEPYKKHSEIRPGRWTDGQALVIHTSEYHTMTIDMTNEELLDLLHTVAEHLDG
jgi:hypothetical protein